jgi:hypothetical protein
VSRAGQVLRNAVRNAAMGNSEAPMLTKARSMIVATVGSVSGGSTQLGEQGGPVKPEFDAARGHCLPRGVEEFGLRI